MVCPSWFSLLPAVPRFAFCGVVVVLVLFGLFVLPWRGCLPCAFSPLWVFLRFWRFLLVSLARLCLLAFLGCFWRLVFPFFCVVGSGPFWFVPVAVGGDLTSLASVHMPILTYQVENTRHTYCCLPPVCCLLWPCAPPPCLVSPQLRKVVNEIRPSHCRFPPLHSSAYAFK